MPSSAPTDLGGVVASGQLGSEPRNCDERFEASTVAARAGLAVVEHLHVPDLACCEVVTDVGMTIDNQPGPDTTADADDHQVLGPVIGMIIAGTVISMIIAGTVISMIIISTVISMIIAGTVISMIIIGTVITTGELGEDRGVDVVANGDRASEAITDLTGKVEIKPTHIVGFDHDTIWIHHARCPNTNPKYGSRRQVD